MSLDRQSPRALVATLLLSSLASLSLLACASGGSREPDRGIDRTVTDTSSIANGDGGKSIENLFAGRFPGVSVARVNGGGLQIRIRGGKTSFFGPDEPLYVVDDTPISPGSGGIVFLNPYDIEKIEVLKNPADVGVYGVRGSNGVILITTKRPGAR